MRAERGGAGLLSALPGWLALAGAFWVSGAALAQSYTIEQFGKPLGTFDMSLSHGPAGTVSDSRLTLQGLAELTDHLVVDASGGAVSYRLSGTARGAAVRVDATLRAGQAEIAIDQAGQQRSVSVPLGGPVVVLDNNMLDGWQLLVQRFRAGGAASQTYDALVPQAASVGSVTVTRAGTGEVSVGGRSVAAQRYDATLKIAGQVVAVQLWADGSGRLLAFAQPSASVRYTLQTEASKAQASASETRGEAERKALEQHLARQRECLTERNVSVRSTGQTLAGSLTVPKGAAAAPALLLIPGSGAVDRNGNVPPLITNSPYQQLAYALACDGYAVLRIDKLGIGASTGNGNDVTLQTYAQNVADWVALLRREEGVDPRRIALMGHSEGGLIALYAAAEGAVDPVTVVLLESPGLPFGQVIVDQIVEQARLRGATEAEAEAAGAQARAAVRAIEASHGSRMALTGSLAENPVAVSFAHAAGLLRSEFAQDPAALAARLRVPVLVVQGGKDVQVSPANGEALRRAAERATYLYLPDLEHGLYRSAGSAIASAMPGPGTRLSGTLLRALKTYLDGYLLGAE